MNVTGNLGEVNASSAQWTMARRLANKQWWLVALLSTLFLAVLFALIFSLSMHRRFSHDEHQFIASAVLVAREQLQPYRDFAYFHVPNQTYLWALFYHFTNYYLLVARTFCAI